MYGEGEDSSSSSHYNIVKIKEFLGKIAERNNRILSTQCAISNLKGKSVKDISDKTPSTTEKKNGRDKYSKPNIRAKKANLIKYDVKKNPKPKVKCKICESNHFTLFCDQVPTDLKEVPPLFKALGICLKCTHVIRDGDNHDTCMQGPKEKHMCPPAWVEQVLLLLQLPVNKDNIQHV